MSQFNCNCSCSEKKYIEQEPEEAVVANAMKEFGYNSVPGLRQTTQVEIGCLYDAVADHKENTQDCLAKCHEARLSTCIDEDDVPIPPGYCSDACAGTTRKDSTPTIGTIDPEPVFESCIENAVRGKCFPSEINPCIREKCQTDTNCISSASSWVYNFCADNKGDVSAPVDLKCLRDAVAEHKENRRNCLAKCEEARLNTCLDEDNAAMAPEYCFVACGGTLNDDYSGVKIDGDVLIDVGDDTSVETDDINIIDDDAEDKKGESDKKASSSSIFGNVNNIIIMFIIVLLLVAAFFGYRIYKNRQTKNSNMFNYTSNYRFREY